MAAGLVVAAIVLGLESRSSKRGWWRAAVAFALSVATHHSSILYAPFMILVAAMPWDGLKPLARRVATMLLAGLLFVGTYEFWSIYINGWSAKVNPVVGARPEGVSLFENTALVALASLVAWSPIEDVTRLLTGGWPKFVNNVYWLATGWLSFSAGCILGLLLPFAPLFPRRWSIPRFHIHVWYWLGAAFVPFVGNALLTPYYSSIGDAQAGLVPLEGLLLILLMLALDRASFRIRARVTALTCVLEILPFVLITTVVSAGLRFSPFIRNQFASSPDDWATLVLPRGLEPLGFLTFPAGIILVLILLFCALQLIKRPGKAAVIEPGLVPRS
jgi:hypothetical protein